jgi:hypothetical protein
MQYSKHHHVFWLKWVFVCHFQTLQWSCFAHCSPYTLTYFLTARSGVLLEKPTGSQPVKKFPAIYGTRMFISAFTSARHISLSWASSIQSIPPHSPIYAYFFQVVSIPQVSHQSTLYASPLPIRATWPAHLILLDLVTRIIFGQQYRSLSSSLCSFLHSPVTASLLGPNILHC